MTGDTEGIPRRVATNAGEIFIKRHVISFTFSPPSPWRSAELSSPLTPDLTPPHCTKINTLSTVRRKEPLGSAVLDGLPDRRHG